MEREPPGHPRDGEEVRRDRGRAQGARARARRAAALRGAAEDVRGVRDEGHGGDAGRARDRQGEEEGRGEGQGDLAASACKLYCAGAPVEVALEAVQLFGGNGDMAEHRVEQLARDAKVRLIYGGADEIQISQIARSLVA